MKKALLLSAVTMLATTAAHAQSSVTLYGLVDVGFTYLNNAGAGAQLSETGSAAAGSRFGLRGREDLGGGLASIFVLESGFSPASGKLSQGGALFGRQAYVGLSSDRWGTVSLGRQYTTPFDLVSQLSTSSWIASGAGYGTHAADVDNVDSANRLNNTIKYTSATVGGLTVAGLYGVGGVAGDVTRNQIWTVAALYAQGPVKVGAGYVAVKQPDYSFFGSNPSASAVGSNMAVNPILSGYATANSEGIFTAGGGYTLGKATLGLFYSNVVFNRLGAVAVTGLTAKEQGYRGTAAFNTGEGNLKYQITPALSVGGSYSYTRRGSVAGDSGAGYQQVNLQVDYFLSKRTDVYAAAIGQKAGGTDSTGARAHAAIGYLTPSSTNRQVLGLVGMRTRF